MVEQARLDVTSVEQAYQENLRTLMEIAKTETAAALGLTIEEVDDAMRELAPALERADAADISAILADTEEMLFDLVLEDDSQEMAFDSQDLQNIRVQELELKDHIDGLREYWVGVRSLLRTVTFSMRHRTRRAVGELGTLPPLGPLIHAGQSWQARIPPAVTGPRPGTHPGESIIDRGKRSFLKPKGTR